MGKNIRIGIGTGDNGWDTWQRYDSDLPLRLLVVVVAVVWGFCSALLPNVATVYSAYLLGCTVLQRWELRDRKEERRSALGRRFRLIWHGCLQCRVVIPVSATRGEINGGIVGGMCCMAFIYVWGWGCMGVAIEVLWIADVFYSEFATELVSEWASQLVSEWVSVMGVEMLCFMCLGFKWYEQGRLLA